MDQSIKAGLAGVALAIFISLFLPSSTPIILAFVPSFLASVIAIFVFKVGTFKDGLVAALITYFFNDAITSAIGWAYYYNKLAPQITVDASVVLSPILEAVTAAIAAYAGARLVRGIRPKKESLSPLTIRPPSL